MTNARAVLSRARREVLTTGLVIAVFLSPALCAAQTERIGPFIRPLVINSLDDHFTVVGKFHGKLIVFDDLISVKFDSLLATRLLPDNTIREARLDSRRDRDGHADQLEPSGRQ